MDEIIHLINEMSPFLLLGFLLAGLMHAFIPGTYFQKYLSKRSWTSVVNAALFGIPLPLCSCGVIPTAMSLRKEGASKGAVVSFLIATPQTGVDSIIATYSLMGWAFAVVRPIAALVTAMLGGTMVNFTDNTPVAEVTGHDDHCSREGGHCDCHDGHCHCHGDHAEHHGVMGKLKEALVYAFVEMMQDIGKWLVVGLIAAGLITVLVPDSLFAVFQGNTFASMLLVLCIAIPMYLCATGSIPIAVALMLKGLTPGAGLVLLMAGPACNFASILVVRKVLGTRTLVTYLASIIVGAIGFGYLIDWLQFSGTVNFMGHLSAQGACCHEPYSWFSWVCNALLAILLLNALVFSRHHHHHHHHETSENIETNNNLMNATIYHIEGMNCNHCRMAAEKALLSVAEVTSASVDLASKEARVEGTATKEDLAKAIDEVGFKLV